MKVVKKVTAKSIKTKEFILEKVAPIFNRRGYTATSLSEITMATGMTKGAIYGNFIDKEELALESFNYIIRRVMGKIKIITDEIESPIAKLFAINNFYRHYYLHQINYGGCPILNVGVDAINNNSRLYHRVKEVTMKLQGSISSIIDEGKEKGEIKTVVNSKNYGGRIFSIIEGAIFTSTLMKDDDYLKDMMNHLDDLINRDLKI